MDIPSRCDWFKKCDSYFENKEMMIQDYLKTFFNRTNTMFEYERLPETIPKEECQLIKQRFGSVTIANDEQNKTYAFYGGLGGVLNEYYHPTTSIVTNPYLKLIHYQFLCSLNIYVLKYHIQLIFQHTFYEYYINLDKIYHF